MRRLVVVLAVIGVLGFGTSRGLDWWNYNVYTPMAQSSQQVVFHIDGGELPLQISEDLYTQRLIRDRNAFDLYVRITNAGPKFEAGTFLLNRNMNMAQIIDALEHGRPDQLLVTIPEGFPLKFAPPPTTSPRRRIPPWRRHSISCLRGRPQPTRPLRGTCSRTPT